MSSPRSRGTPARVRTSRPPPAGCRPRAHPLAHQDHRRGVGGRRGRLRDLHQPGPPGTRRHHLRVLRSRRSARPAGSASSGEGTGGRPASPRPTSLLRLPTSAVAATGTRSSAAPADRGQRPWPTRPRALAVYRTTRWSTTVELVVTDPRLVARGDGHPPAAAGPGRAGGQPLPSRFGDRSPPGQPWPRSPSWPHPVSDDLYEAVAIAVRAAALSDGAVDPTVGSALCAPGLRPRLLGPGRRRGRHHARWPVPCPVGRRSPSTPSAGPSGSCPAPCWISGPRPRRGPPTGPVPPSPTSSVAAPWSRWAVTSPSGMRPTGGFTVGIADVCGDRTTSVQVSVAHGGLATSGIGRRHWRLGGHPVHHLIDPDTGLPGGLLLEDRVGGRRLVRRRQHRLHGGHGQRSGGGDLARGAGTARPSGAHRRTVT